MGEGVIAMQISDNLRISIKAKKAAQEFNRRRGVVQLLMNQHGCDVHQAIELFKNTVVNKIGHVPDDVLADLNQIREELSQDASTITA